MLCVCAHVHVPRTLAAMWASVREKGSKSPPLQAKFRSREIIHTHTHQLQDVNCVHHKLLTHFFKFTIYSEVIHYTSLHILTQIEIINYVKPFPDNKLSSTFLLLTAPLDISYLLPLIGFFQCLNS